jgi:hypothetical protein
MRVANNKQFQMLALTLLCLGNIECGYDRIVEGRFGNMGDL